MELNKYIRLWSESPVTVLHIETCGLARTHAHGQRKWECPSPLFVCIRRGRATVRIASCTYTVNQRFILHACQDQQLEIMADQQLEYDLIWYRWEADMHSDLSHLPTAQPFGFEPSDCLPFFKLADAMLETWSQGGDRAQLRIKMLFYQWLNAVADHIDLHPLAIARPDLGMQMIHYLEEHVGSMHTLEDMAQALNYSVDYLSRTFRHKFRCSPNQYLTQLRLRKAKHLLRNTEAPLAEIARHCGYRNLHYFHRIFKKQVGLTPGSYRQGAAQMPTGRLRTLGKPDLCIERPLASPYIDNDDHYLQKREGESTMNKENRWRPAASLLLGFALLLSACSGAQTAPVKPEAGTGSAGAAVQAGSTQNETNAGQAAQAQARTRIIDTIKGEVTIPEDPQRIVAEQYLGSFVALDVTPIGMVEGFKSNPYLADSLQQVEEVGGFFSNVEKIASLEPDLIITGNDNEEHYSNLSKIAPTILIKYGYFQDAHEEIRYLGEVLNKQGESEAWLNDYELRIQQARERVAQVIPPDTSFSILQITDKSVWAYGDNYGRGGQAVYQGLGFSPPAAVEQLLREEQYAAVSLEVLADFAGDYILLTADQMTLEDLQADPIWSRLEAVQNNRVLIWDQAHAVPYDPVAVLTQTEWIADWLTR